MRKLFAAIIAALLLAASPTLASKHRQATTAAAATTADLQLFSTEAAAHQHCPSDTVVWLNTNSGIYHEKGMRWYGNTKAGAYVCKAEADKAGDRDTRNGQ